jgi:hypothetical protein
MSKITTLLAFLFLTASSAWAQTTPAPAPDAAPGTAPAGDAAAAGGGVGDYWWVILLAIIVIAAIVYFSRRGRNRV